MEAYGIGGSSSNYEETSQRYELKKHKKKKRKVVEEEKDEVGVCHVLTTSLDDLDWESVIKNMEEEVNLTLNIMVQLLGVKKEVALLQFQLLRKSLHIRNHYVLLLLNAFNKEHFYEQQEYEVLKKILDVEMIHMQLIRDAHTNLIKIATDKGIKTQKMVEKAEEQNNKQLLEKLVEIQDKLDKINEEARDQVLRIAKKYNKIRKPVYEKRNNVIKDIANFWLSAFLRHPILSELITEEDQEIFKFLSSMEVKYSKDVKSGYTITFYFNPNPYFRNTMLSKIYTFFEDGRPTTVTASIIQWSEGNGSVSPHAEDGFFRWFSSEVNEKDDGIAALITDELWQNPLAFFNEDDEEKVLHEADDDVVKNNEHDGDEEADEEDRKAAEDCGDEVVKDSEDDIEGKDNEDDVEEDIEGKDIEGSHDDYDLGGR